MRGFLALSSSELWKRYPRNLFTYTSVANSSSDPYRLLFLLVMACIDAAVGKSYFLVFTEDFEVVGGCESLQKRKEHIRVSTLTCHNGLTKSRHPLLQFWAQTPFIFTTLLRRCYLLLLLLVTSITKSWESYNGVSNKPWIIIIALEKKYNVLIL